jgi:hypothetical protein
MKPPTPIDPSEPVIPRARPYPRRLRPGVARRCNMTILALAPALAVAQGSARFLRLACNRVVDPDRRAHKCPRCVTLRHRGQMPTGPCAVCGSADLRVLSRVDLADGVHDLCANCSAIAAGARYGDAAPVTLEELRAEVWIGHGPGGLLEELLGELDAAA